MDPVTAACNAVAAVAKLFTAIVEGQTPEQKKYFGDRWVDIDKFWQNIISKLAPPQ